MQKTLIPVYPYVASCLHRACSIDFCGSPNARDSPGHASVHQLRRSIANAVILRRRPRDLSLLREEFHLHHLVTAWPFVAVSRFGGELNTEGFKRLFDAIPFGDTISEHGLHRQGHGR